MKGAAALYLTLAWVGKEGFVAAPSPPLPL